MNVSKNVIKTDWVDPDDAPELTGEELTHAQATWRIAGEIVTSEAGKTAFRSLLGKRKINIMLDAAVIEHFKAKAGERGYQTLINKTLREAIERDRLEQLLRRIIREELEQSR